MDDGTGPTGQTKHFVVFHRGDERFIFHITSGAIVPHSDDGIKSALKTHDPQASDESIAAETKELVEMVGAEKWFTQTSVWKKNMDSIWKRVGKCGLRRMQIPGRPPADSGCDGYGCPVPGCGWVCSETGLTKSRVRDHLKLKHPDVQPDQKPEHNIRWILYVLMWTKKEQPRYIRLAPDPEAPIMAPSIWGGEALKAKIQTQRDGRRGDPPGTDEASNQERVTNTFLDQIGFANHVGGLDLAELAPLVSITGEMSTKPLPDVSRQARVFQKTIKATSMEAQKALRMQGGSVISLRVNRRADEDRDPFTTVDAATMDKYARAWGQLIAYVLRVHLAQEDPASVDSQGWPKLPALTSAQRAAAAAAMTLDETQPEETRRSLVVDLVWALLDQELRTNEFDNPIASGLALLAIRREKEPVAGGRTARWMSPVEYGYDSTMSAVMKLGRLVVFHKSMQGPEVEGGEWRVHPRPGRELTSDGRPTSPTDQQHRQGRLPGRRQGRQHALELGGQGGEDPQEGGDQDGSSAHVLMGQRYPDDGSRAGHAYIDGEGRRGRQERPGGAPRQCAVRDEAQDTGRCRDQRQLQIPKRRLLVREGPGQR